MFLFLRITTSSPATTKRSWMLDNHKTLIAKDIFKKVPAGRCQVERLVSQSLLMWLFPDFIH